MFMVETWSLSQQGVWVPFWTPKPLKRIPQDTQFFLCAISKNLNLKLIVEFFHLHIIHITSYKDIMPCSDEFVHVYGWNLSILWSPLKIRMPKIFTSANFRHPVSKSWLKAPAFMPRVLFENCCLELGYSQNIWRGIVGWIIINISHSNTYWRMLLLERYHRNPQALNCGCCEHDVWGWATKYTLNMQGLSQDFCNRVSKMRFQENRVSKPSHWKIISHHTDHIHWQIK